MTTTTSTTPAAEPTTDELVAAIDAELAANGVTTDDAKPETDAPKSKTPKRQPKTPAAKSKTTTAKRTGGKTTTKTSAAKTTTAKTGAKPKRGGQPKPSQPKPTDKPAVAERIGNARMAEHQPTARLATAIMRWESTPSAKPRNAKRSPVSTPQIAAVRDALGGKSVKDAIGPVPAIERIATEHGTDKDKDVAAKMRAFSSEHFGAASTKNKLRGAKIAAVLAAIAHADGAKLSRSYKS